MTTLKTPSKDKVLVKRNQMIINTMACISLLQCSYDHLSAPSLDPGYYQNIKYLTRIIQLLYNKYRNQIHFIIKPKVSFPNRRLCIYIKREKRPVTLDQIFQLISLIIFLFMFSLTSKSLKNFISTT